MFNSSNNLSKRASTKAIEEIFTDNDIVKNGSDISVSYTKEVGFSFDYPMRWLNDSSEMKAIGLRRCKVIPTSHVFKLTYQYQYKIKGKITNGTNKVIRVSVTPDNNLDEIIAFILNLVNSHMATKTPYAFLNLAYEFNYRTGEFEFILFSEGEGVTDCKFNFKNSNENDDINLEHFLKFLNQERSQENKLILSTPTDSMKFFDVWDRKSLMFHSSFSDAKRNYLGLNADNFDRPTKFYDPPTNASNFQIRFTTDGTHNLLPRYCQFIVELSFIYNYKNSLITK